MLTATDDLECTIRDHIAASGLSINRLSNASGVARSTIRRFCEGGGIRASTLCKVAEAAGLRIYHQPVTQE